jgi:cobalt/nickel transport system permease protein
VRIAGPSLIWYHLFVHLIEHLQGRSIIHRLDPRIRILSGFGLSAIIALSKSWPVIGLGAASALALLFAARVGPRVVFGRLIELNVFMLMVLLLVPFSMPGEPLFCLGPAVFSRQGLIFALAITLKGNAVVMTLTALLSTIETVTLGHALNHLKVPDKLIHLFLFTVRYIDVLHHEYLRLRQAMKCRCFRVGMNLHTYRTLGNLVAILLIRSLDRSERIMRAMKCRGFTGRFWMLDHFHTHNRDIVFAVGALLFCAALIWLELK